MTPAMTPAMTPERYQQVGKLFDEALEHAPEERAAFLKQASGDDAELRIEVEKLLAHQVESAEFLSRPAMQVAASLLAQNQTPSINVVLNWLADLKP